MPRTCTVCSHARRPEVDAALLAGEPYRSIAQRFAASPDAVLRHKAHVAPALAEAKRAERVACADSLLGKVAELEADARRLGRTAEKAGDARTALAAVRELTRIVELLGRLRGELDAKGAVNVNLGMSAGQWEEATRRARVLGAITFAFGFEVGTVWMAALLAAAGGLTAEKAAQVPGLGDALPNLCAGWRETINRAAPGLEDGRGFEFMELSPEAREVVLSKVDFFQQAMSPLTDDPEAAGLASPHEA